MEKHCNLLKREDERQLIPICKQQCVSLIPYIPLAAGHLSKKTGKVNQSEAKQIKLQPINTTVPRLKILRLYTEFMRLLKSAT